MRLGRLIMIQLEYMLNRYSRSIKVTQHEREINAETNV
jgi:hypothetical protein